MAVEGQRGLWRGFTAAMYRAIPVNASIFLAVEGTRAAINEYTAWEKVHGGAKVEAAPGVAGAPGDAMVLRARSPSE